MKYTLNYLTATIGSQYRLHRHQAIVQAESIPEACELLWQHVQPTRWVSVDEWTLFEEDGEVGIPCWRVQFEEGRVSNGTSIEDTGDLQEVHFYVYKPLVAFTPQEVGAIEYDRVSPDGIWAEWCVQSGKYPTAGVLFDLTIATYTEETPLLSLRERV